MSASAGFGYIGLDASIGISYAPLGDQGFILGVSKFYGVGDPGPSYNFNWGDTIIKK
jgi:hypothetical protein